jgi:hypothetical protein
MLTSDPASFRSRGTWVAHGDGDLASSVSRSDVIDRLMGFAQRVRAVDDRCDLAGFDQLLADDEILEVR